MNIQTQDKENLRGMSLWLAGLLAFSTVAVPSAAVSDPVESEDPQIIPAVEEEDSAQDQLVFLMALHQQILQNFGKGVGSISLNHSRQFTSIGDGSRFIDRAFYRHFIFAQSGGEHLKRIRQARHHQQANAGPSPEGDRSTDVVTPPTDVGGGEVLDLGPTLFDENLDYLNAGWPVMLERLTNRYGWVYSWEKGEWDFDPSRGTIPSFILDPNDAAYHLAYELDTLTEVAIKTHDLEKIEILVKFYTTYLYGPESPFMTLRELKAALEEAKDFLNDLPRLTGISDPEALAAVKISDLISQYDLTLPIMFNAGMQDLEMTVGYFQETRLPALSIQILGHPGDPSRGVTRESVAQVRVFLEEFLRQHPEYDSSTTMRTIRRNHPDLVMPELMAMFGSGSTLGSIRDTMNLWDRRFRSGMDNPNTDADEERLFLPYLSGEYGSTDVDHPKALTQVMFSAGKLMVEIAKMTAEERAQHPGFAEFSRKVADFLLHDVLFPTIFDQYEIRYAAVMGDEKNHNRWEWWTAIMALTPEQIQALPDGRAAAIRDWEAFWVPALLTAVLAVNNLHSDLAVMTEAEVAKAKEIVTLILGLVDKQTFRSTMTLPDGTVVTLGNFQEHLWLQDLWVPDDSEGNFDISHFSNRFPRSSAAIRAGLRLAELGQLLPAFESWMTSVVNQFVYEDTTWVQIPGTDVLAPLFNNYIGDNARYRDGHPSSPDGFGPYGLSYQVVDTWSSLADFHPELRRVIHTLETLARSTDPMIWAWVNQWYRGLHRTDATGRRQQFWNFYYGLLANYGG